jgi:PAS domain S-box-containing protein
VEHIGDSKRQLLQALIDAIQQPVIVLDSCSRVVNANEALYDTYRLKPRDTISLPLARLHQGSWNTPLLNRTLGEVRRSGSRSSAIEVHAQFPKLGYRSMVVTAARLPDSFDSDTLLLVTIEDVTEHEKAATAEQSLRLSEARKSAILEVALDCIISIDADGRIVEFNPAAEHTFRYRREDVLGKTIHDTIIPPELRANHLNGMERYRQSGVGPVLGRRLELVGMRNGGEQFPVELTIVPFEDGTDIQFTAYLRDITDRKAAESIQAEMLEHEHTIASQLQVALQPDVPSSVPGLTLSKYYEPALPESGVGGDFIDCFETAPGVSCLIVGDLSGKGLAAATQVATVRNMLRFAVYERSDLADQITTLNAILANYNLLPGFATLFVGRYDANEQTLTYVNCGQEPALLRYAATGIVEQFGPTGLVLGAVPESEYVESTVQLGTGDVLAIFTDGLTEAGPSRTQLLGIDGVSKLLEEAARSLPGTKITAEVLALEMIKGVDRYASEGIRDDVCLLVALVG